MMSMILPLVSIAMAFASPGEGSADDAVATKLSPRAAQERLAQTLADADSIDEVSSDLEHRQVTFKIDRAGEAYSVIAKTRRTGEVISVEIRDEGEGTFEIGGLTWLSDTMRGTDAVVRLLIDEDGGVTLTTSEGQRFMAIPGRGSGGNEAVEARWAAEWNNA